MYVVFRVHKKWKKHLQNICKVFIIIKVVLDSSAVEHSAVNRRVVGSNPTRGVLKSVSQLLTDFNFEKINIRLRGQAVKTSPFHGGNTGSIPVGVIWRHSQVVRQRSATPLSPVQIWLAPLGEIWKQLFPDFLVYKYNIPYIKMRYVKNVLPTSKNNRKYIENQLSGAIEQMEEYIRKYPMFLVMDYV